MTDGEDLYKREEDRMWRQRTDERLVALTSGETVQNDRLDEIDEEIHTVKEILEGRANDKNDNGIKGDIHDLSVTVNALRALMAPDSLGQGGVIARLKALERRAGLEELSIANRGKTWIAILGVISALLVALLSNLDRITALVHKKSTDPLDRMYERAKRPPNPKKIYRYRVIPPPNEPDPNE